MIDCCEVIFFLKKEMLLITNYILYIIFFPYLINFKICGGFCINVKQKSARVLRVGIEEGSNQ